MRILTTTIGVPTLAFGSEPEPKVDTPETQLNLDDKVAGEQEPDWSFLDGEAPPDAPHASQVPQEGASEPPPAPPPQNEAPTGTPPKVPITDPNDELPIPAVKPQTEEEPMPDPQQELEAQKKEAEDKKAAEEAAAAPVKPVEPPAVTEEVKLPTEEEIDAMQLKPGASAKHITDFKNLKEMGLKPAVREAVRLRAVVAELEKRPAITPEIQAKLTEADKALEWYDAFMLDNSPRVQKEFTEKQTKAEETLFTLLRDHPRLKMTQEAIDKYKEFGLDSPKGIATRNTIIKAVREAAAESGDEFLLDEVKDAFKARDNVIKEHERKIESLKNSQGGLIEAKANMEKEERMEWAKEADKALIDIVKDKPEFLLKPVPANANPAQKLEVDAHNKRINEELVPLLHAGIRAIHGRDAKVTLKHLVESMRVPVLESSLKATKAELDAAKKRVAELEGDGARMRRVASPSHIDSAPVGPAKPSPTKSEFDMTADEAVDAYLAEQHQAPVR